jgi:hypothetical protein
MHSHDVQWGKKYSEECSDWSLYGSLENGKVNNCALSSNNSMALFYYNSYCKLDSSVKLTTI